MITRLTLVFALRYTYLKAQVLMFQKSTNGRVFHRSVHYKLNLICMMNFFFLKDESGDTYQTPTHV
jgi:hypothetical protein